VSADKVARLMTLLNVLVGADRPLTSREIRAQVPGYATDDVAFRRAFERDKKELGEIVGQPIAPEPVPGTDPPVEGYRLRAERTFLRDPGLTDEERRALAVAASAVRVSGIDPAPATAKVGAEGGPDAAADDGAATEIPADDVVVALFQAVAERREAAFTYNDEPRVVHPWQVRFTRGRWYLSAHDVGRGAARTFRLDRATGPVTLGAPGSFPSRATEAPVPLDEPWLLGDGPVEEVVVRVDAARAEAARRAVPGASVTEGPDGSVRLTLLVRNRPALRSLVLGFGPDAEVESPDAVRADVVGWLEATVAAAGGVVGGGAGR
jgi:proteasome accessory factor B